MFRSIRRFSQCSVQLAADKSRYIPLSGTYPQGYLAGGTHCGIKAKSELNDLSIIASEIPASAAAVFTQNIFKAAPVQISSKVLHDLGGSGVRAIVTNSGCANAVTGEGGLEDSRKMVQAIDAALEEAPTDGDIIGKSLVMSTGVIGQRLPISKIVDGIPKLVEKLGTSHEHWIEAAKGICTTDTFPKLLSKEFCLAGSTYRLAGMAKGAGMIHPNMATLLGFMVTDAPVEPKALQKILKYAVDRSFNSITIDGDTSTNDTIALLANGAAGGNIISENSDEFKIFQDIVTDAAESLAKLVVRDGEGATKFVTIHVKDALSFDDAKKVATTIAESSLVKTALYGEDANWGRILCATGYAGVPVEPFKTCVSFIPTDGSPKLDLLINGEPEPVDELRASKILEAEDLEIEILLGTGGGHDAQIWTCDFSHEYVTINGDYRT